jgi:hypothetical protein
VRAEPRVVLRGKVVWNDPEDLTLKRADQAIRIFVNGFQQRPADLQAASPGGTERAFETTVLLNRQKENRIDFELPGLRSGAAKQPHVSVAECDKFKPNQTASRTIRRELRLREGDFLLGIVGPPGIRLLVACVVAQEQQGAVHPRVVAGAGVGRLGSVTPTGGHVRGALGLRPRLLPLGFLLLVFAGLALLLSTVGLYGVLSYSALRRLREIGIRLALGAQRSDIGRLILGQGIRLLALGLTIGLAGILVCSRLLRSFLFEVNAIDPPIYLGVALLLAVAAILACLIPARRAAFVDPIVTLRAE